MTVAAGNARLDRSLTSMKETPLIKWTFDSYNDEHRASSARQPFEIVQALENRNAAWAEAITRCHILAAEKAVLDRYERGAPFVVAGRSPRIEAPHEQPSHNDAGDVKCRVP
ncbi:hypothetical protein [Paraburkholderia atlantica]|uniref:hypothetical protein n=1 Tax=Paraburkholderia atlantica TaxID=2654982 RepID=UPI0035D43C7F